MRRLDVFVLVVALVNVVVVLELVRRRQLREKYALLWLAVGVGGIVLGLGRTVVDRVAHALGVDYGPSAVFLLAILFLLLVCMHLSWEVSRLEERTGVLAEELALLRARDDGAGPSPGTSRTGGRT
ncbi:MAG TPA: DUF2304 domain-containing protein [Acidimicrobiales bacterium]|nr:DUF2304 domain-containing protein [Acidimicrobiales bacterium]